MFEDIMKNAVWPGGAQPRLPAFAGKVPPPMPGAASIHETDTLMVSFAGRPLEPMTLRRFMSLLKDKHSDGLIYVGEPDGSVGTASFAFLRAYFSSPAGSTVHLPPHR